MNDIKILKVFAVMVFVLFALWTAPAPVFSEVALDWMNGTVLQTANLDACIQEALQNNRRRPASRFAVEMAEAQHRQALAGYWPQINFRGGYQLMDDEPNFLFPARSMSVPAFPGLNLDIPAQDVKLMDRQSYIASVDAAWLIFDGGMRKGYREQTKGLVDMMKQEARRTDLEIIDSVKRMYYGAVLADQLYRVGNDTLARMEATLNFTETLYKEGSGKVKKTDWLDNKVMVESLRSMVATLEKNMLMARAALANTMGMPWDSSVTPVDREIPHVPFADRLEDIVSTAYRFNPDWARVEAGIHAAEGAVRTAQSGHFPKIALTGEVHKWWNGYDAGLATDRNKEGWTLGVGVEIPLFSGLLTHNKIAEARARVSKIKEEQILFREGIGLQIKDTFLSLNAAEKSHRATGDAMKAAVENRDLNTRAYQNELVDTEKVIRAQLMEALMSAQHYKARYDQVVLLSQMNLLVGTEVLKKIEGVTK